MVNNTLNDICLVKEALGNINNLQYFSSYKTHFFPQINLGETPVCLIGLRLAGGGRKAVAL